MKTIMMLVNMVMMVTAVYPQVVQRPQRAVPPKIYSQQSVVTLLNNTKDLLKFQLRYDTPGAQWATYQLSAGERKAVPVRGSYLNLYMANTGKLPLTYSLVAGKNYQFYWSVPRGMYDVDLMQ
ncbi:hypothetical protein G8759_23880 [Spirosoma aureum]|uniref:Uncharacterized protein n=1 Tax=Spirosoma aureum TaxID=2692134 RepID=A0A6G9AT01_9BACT|nr:hypothetical protein [Spirosoma aureum]QIP15456.1 hypothetical protein G8759_23880 [Spirosoma aureum]